MSAALASLMPDCPTPFFVDLPEPKPTRQIVDVTVFDVVAMTSARGHLSARGFVEELLDHLGSVPEQYRDAIKFSYRPDGYGGLEECRAHYRRRETDAEFKSRLEEAEIKVRTAREQQERIAANRAAAERKEYERLKALFEPAPVDTVAQL